MKYLKVWTSFRDVMAPLADAEKGRLFDAMLNYTETGAEPGNFAGNERFTWPAAKQMIDLMIAENARLTKNGKKGGRPETNNNQEKPNETKDNQTKPTKTQKEKKIKEKEGNEKEILDKFERFWTAYPRKVAKPDAMRKFEALKPDDNTMAAIMAAIERSKGSEQWKKDGGQYIPHPSTWLNQRRWEDDPPIKAGPTVIAQAYSQRDYSNEQEEAMLRMLGMVTA